MVFIITYSNIVFIITYCMHYHMISLYTRLASYWAKIMASPATVGLALAFRNHQPLQPFILSGVTPTGKILGTGSYGSVEEVCIAINNKSSHICSCIATKL